MIALSDLSVEFAHLYLAHLDEQAAELAARSAKRWVMPIVDRWEEAGLTVSTVVMLDDYFAPEGTDIAEQARIVHDACEQAGVRVDHVAYEAACAGSVSRLRAQLRREPRDGDGSSIPPPEDVGSDWLANGDPPRGRQLETVVGARLWRTGATDPAVALRTRERPRGNHAIHLDVQLWKDERGPDSRVWACPTLSAWWQLIRLGMLRDETTGRPAAPPGTQSRDDAPPLPARRTLTLLDPRFLEVEHAVRVILERVSLPDAWRRHLREGELMPGTHAHLERIGYLFLPHWRDSASVPPLGVA